MSRRSGPRRHLRGAAAATATLLLAGAAFAQEGPVVIGEQQKREPFKLTNPHAALELEYRHESDSIKTQGEPESKFTENRFEEKVQLWSPGYIVHPNLVELNLSGTIGLIQDDVTNDQNGVSLNESENNLLYEWDLSALFLRKQSTTYTLYSRRTMQTISREFGPSIDSTVMQTGGVVDFRSKTIPTRIEVYRLDQKQTSPGGLDDFTMGQNTLNWHSEWKPTPRQDLTWDYTFNAVDETNENGQSNSFNTHDATLTHSLDFGPLEKYNLTSSITYFNQSGDFGLERFRWDEWLRLKHSDSFETYLRTTVDQQSVDEGEGGSSDQTRYHGEGGFTHRLYKSLVTQGVLGAEQITRSQAGDTQEEFARLDTEYTKLVPGGVLILNAGTLWDTQDNGARTGITSVLDASGSFTDPLPIVITGQNIMPRSIRITDPTGLIIYLPTRDYRVSGFADHVEISRVVGGRIAAGQPILIDYDLAPQGANTVDTLNFHFGGRYRIERGFLRGLSVYARYAHQDQSISSDTENLFTPNSFTNTVLGSELKRGDFTLGAEQEYNDATIQPYDATRLWARFEHRLGRDTQLALSTSYSTLDFTDTNNHVTLWLSNAQINHQFSSDLRGMAMIIYRNDTDELLGDTRGIEEQLELRWDHRQLHIYIQARNANLNTEGEDTSFQMIQVGLRREF